MTKVLECNSDWTGIYGEADKTKGQQEEDFQLRKTFKEKRQTLQNLPN